MKVAVMLVALMLGGPPTSPPDPGPFESLRAMTGKQKREMRSRNYHLNRLKKKIQQAMACKRCRGSGRVAVMVQEPGVRGGVNREVSVECPLCAGTKRGNTAKVYDLLAEYIRLRDQYETAYPFVGKIKLGVEEMVIKRISDGATVLAWNSVFVPHLRFRSLRKGDVLIVGVSLYSASKEDRRKGILKGFVSEDHFKSGDPTVYLHIEGEIPKDVTGWSYVIVIATYQKLETITTLDGEKLYFHHLRVRSAKNF